MAMDAKEIELRGKAIAKAMQESEPSSSLLKLLGDLKTGVHATEDILRQTRIGVTINRLRTHKDPAVQRAAGGAGAACGVVCAEPGVDASLMKLAELRLNILSASLTGALRRVAVPAPPAVVVVAAPLI